MNSMNEGNGNSFWRDVVDFCREHSVMFTAIGFIGSLVLGYIGFGEYSAKHQDNVYMTVYDRLYSTLQLISLESGGLSGGIVSMIDKPIPSSLQWARFLVPLFSALAIIEAIIAVAREHWELFLTKYRGNHIVICGLGQKGRRLAELFRSQGKRVIVIEKDDGNDEIATMRAGKILVIVGNAMNTFIMEKARIHACEKIFIVAGGDDTNIAIAYAMRLFHAERCRSKGHKTKCFVHIADPSKISYFKDHVDFGSSTQTFEAQCLNPYSLTAQFMLQDNQLALSFDSVKLDIMPHLLLVGLTSFSKSLILEIIQYCHYRDERDVRITVVCESNASWSDSEKSISLAGKENWLHFYGANDLKAFLEGTSELATIQDNGKKPFTAVCINGLDNEEGARLAQLVRQKLAQPAPIRVISRDNNFTTFMNDVNFIRTADIRFIDLDQIACTHLATTDDEIERTAEAIHAEYIRYQKDQYPQKVNDSMKVWDDLSEELKESNRRQARDIPFKLRMLGYDVCPAISCNGVITLTPDEIDLLACIEHKRWCVEKKLNGWEYGDPPDRPNKKHELLKPWEELNDDGRKINLHFAGNISKFLAASGRVITARKP